MLGPAIRLFLTLTVLTGIIYPLIITLISYLAWPHVAQGSFLMVKDQIVGSKYIGQQFTDKKYFWSRPSAVNYLPMPAGASNLGPSNPTLKEQVEKRAAKILESHPKSTFKTIPSELLYASASGVDPDISVNTALFQLERVSKARGWNEATESKVMEMIVHLSKYRIDRFFSVPYVNVLELNIAIDEIK